MTRYMQGCAIVLLAAIAVAPAVLAQDAPQPADPPAARLQAAAVPTVSLGITVVLSRHREQKQVSSLPYALAVTAAIGAGPSSLRMGGEVPVRSGSPQSPTVSYRAIGTNIDASAIPLDADRFRLLLTVEDSSVYEDPAAAGAPDEPRHPVFRTFRTTNTVVLRDGQTVEFTAATDRVSGEIVRVAVTLNVLK